MSRTDKDMPWWTAGVWAAEHTRACTARRERCTLPPERPRPRHWSWRAYLSPGCYWDPQDGRRPIGSPPRWFVNHRWSASDRMATRVACDRARAEHRAGREPETEPPARQHRHGARWDWF